MRNLFRDRRVPRVIRSLSWANLLWSFGLLLSPWGRRAIGDDRRIWLLLLFGAGPGLVLAIIGNWIASRRETIERNRQANGLCPTCGYDLRATPECCPECGFSPSPSPQRGEGRGEGRDVR